MVLTDEAFPRLSVVASRATGRSSSARSAPRPRPSSPSRRSRRGARLRTCSQRIRRRDPDGTPCALADLGRCGAPCAGAESAEEYARARAPFADLVAGRSARCSAALRARLDRLAAAGRYEDGGTAARPDGGAGGGRCAGGSGSVRWPRWPNWWRPPRTAAGGWWLVVIRHGRLVASGRARRGVDPMPVVDLLVASAETVQPRPGPLPGASRRGGRHPAVLAVDARRPAGPDGRSLVVPDRGRRPGGARHRPRQPSPGIAGTRPCGVVADRSARWASPDGVADSATMTVA